MRKTKTATAAEMTGDVRIQEFLDMIAPSVIQFETDHFICGNTFRCVWALREYPTATDEQAILSHLGEKDGVTLRIYTRHVTPVEERKIISNAANKNRMDRNNTNDLQQTVLAESNLQDVATIVTQMHRNREPLLHTAVYLELCAHDIDQLKLLQTEVLTGHIGKLRVLRHPHQVDGADGAVSLLGDDDFRHVGVFRVLIVVVVTVEEHHHVRVLLDGSRLTQVGKHGTVVRSRLTGTAKLGQSDHRGV